MPFDDSKDQVIKKRKTAPLTIHATVAFSHSLLMYLSMSNINMNINIYIAFKKYILTLKAKTTIRTRKAFTSDLMGAIWK